jgi:hypothetical protein
MGESATIVCSLFMMRVWRNTDSKTVHYGTACRFNVGDSGHMPNTGERREIKRYTNAKENETVVKAKKLVSKTKQGSAKVAGEEMSRERRNNRPLKAPLSDAEASDRMVDEGNPNAKPSAGKI